MNNLFKDKSDQKYIIWDTETCNVNLIKDNDCWQLGFLLCQGTQIIEKHAYFIKWEPLNISAGAAMITKFDQYKYMASWREPIEILDLFESYLYNEEYKNLGHHLLGFDVYVHNQWRNKLGRKTDYSYLKRLIDTDCLARGIKNGIKYDGKSDFLAYQYRVGSIIKKGVKTSLKILGKENGIEFDYENLHDATLDVQLNWEIWNRVIKNHVDI